MAIFSGLPKGYSNRVSGNGNKWFRRISGFGVDPKERAYRNIDQAIPEVGRMIQAMKPRYGVVPSEVPARPHHRPQAPIRHDKGVKGLEYAAPKFLPKK